MRCPVVLLGVFVVLSFYIGLSAPALAQEYRIRPGDVLDISVLGNDDLSQQVAVQPDGSINYPFMQDIKADLYTLRELEIIIRSRLTGFMEQVPPVTITLASRYAVNITVIGAVSNPGSYTIPAQSTIQGAITAAGGPTLGARLNEVRLTRTRGEEQTTQYVNLDAFLDTGDPNLLPPLDNGDIITVPGGSLASSTVKVLGAVNRPGVYTPRENATVFDLIIEAGGFTEDAQAQKTRLFRPQTGQAENYSIDIDQYLRTGEISFSPPVQPGDVIVVPRKLVTWGKFLGFVRDILTIATLVFFINRL